MLIIIITSVSDVLYVCVFIYTFRSSSHSSSIVAYSLQCFPFVSTCVFRITVSCLLRSCSCFSFPVYFPPFWTIPSPQPILIRCPQLNFSCQHSYISIFIDISILICHLFLIILILVPHRSFKLLVCVILIVTFLYPSSSFLIIFQVLQPTKAPFDK